MLFNITKEEHLRLLKERELKKKRELTREKQASCSHKNSYVYGRGGHNNDTWYRCRDCGYEWDV